MGVAFSGPLCWCPPVGPTAAWSIRGGRWGGAGSLAASLVYETACAPLLSRGSARGCTRADADGPLAFGPALIFVFVQRRNSELVYVFLSSSETVN